MKKTVLAVLSAATLVAGAYAELLTNGDWESTLNPNWGSQNSGDTNEDLNGWISSLKTIGNVNGAYIEPISGYGSGLVAAMKAVTGNYFQQTLAGVNASRGEATVNYDGGIRYHSSYTNAVRNINLTVSLWDTTANVELDSVTVVTAFSSTETSLHARSHTLSYDGTGLGSHTLAVRFANTSVEDGALVPNYQHSQVLIDNMVVTVVESSTPPLIFSQPQDATASESGSHTFSVSVSGTSPLGYQWMKGGIELSGKTASSLLLSNLSLADEGGYSVWITNAFGSATSTVATLTVVDDAADFDGDGLPDIWEIENGLDSNDDGSVNPDNGASGDPDSDGLPNDEEFFMDSDPQVNESGKAWQPRPEKVRLMVVSAHPDDEGIFFGGLIPYYTQVRQLPTVSVSVTSGDAGTRPPELREAEFRNAVWAYGLRNQPLFPRFKDYPKTYGMDRMWDIWADGVDDGGTPEQVALGQEKLTRTLATYFRRYRPEVVVTHDFLGEYGHTNHKGTALGCEWAVEMAADPAVDLDGLPAWQVKKFYVHMHGSGGDPDPSAGAKKLFHDFWQEVSIDTTGNGTPDQTPTDVANTGVNFHASQGDMDVSTCYENGENFGDYPSEWWELHETAVADDTILPDFTEPNANLVSVTYSGWAMGDFFEHLTTFPDSDYDQLADGWELDHFATLAAADPAADDDGDGHDNTYEFMVGLDPQTPDDIDMRIAAGQTVEFTLPAATGPGYESLVRSYQLLFSSDLTDWSTVVAEGIADGTQGDYIIPTGVAKGFYRLVITLE